MFATSYKSLLYISYLILLKNNFIIYIVIISKYLNIFFRKILYKYNFFFNLVNIINLKLFFLLYFNTYDFVYEFL